MISRYTSFVRDKRSPDSLRGRLRVDNSQEGRDLSVVFHVPDKNVEMNFLDRHVIPILLYRQLVS